MRALLLVLLCTLASAPQPADASPNAKKKAAAPKADIVVVAELVRSAGGLPHCGVLAVVGEYEFRIVAVESGKLDDERIVVEALCPEMSMESYHLSRLELSSKRLHRYQPMRPLENAPAKRLYLHKQDRFSYDYTKLLGKPLKKVTSKFTATEPPKDGWQRFGPGLAVQTTDSRVSKLRVSSPQGFPRSFAWLGLAEVDWQTYRRKGGYSNGTFKTPTGILGRAQRGTIEIEVDR